MTKPNISSAVDSALQECGRHRVHHRDHPPGIAIRWQPQQVPPDEQWIVSDGDDYSTAGHRAAKEFANRLAAEANRLQAWAERIRRQLDNEDNSNAKS